MKTIRKIFILCILKTFTKTILVTFSLLLSCPSLSAQFSDNFSDQNFTADPSWTGSTESFSSSAGILQLSAPAGTSVAWLVTPSSGIAGMEWEFYIRLSFNPSASNYACFYLAADQPDLSKPLNGYYVQVGGQLDDISLFRQNGNTRTKIIDGPDAQLNLNDVVAKVKVICSPSGQWQLLSDIGFTGQFSSSGTAVDRPTIHSSWVGFMCVYTSTRADKFFLDDVEVRPSSAPDDERPGVSSVKVISPTSIELVFTEPVSASTAADPANYEVSNDSGRPVTAQVSTDSKSVLLTFSRPFTNGKTSVISVSGITDLAGNEMVAEHKEFVFFIKVPAVPRDIVITEVFPDPSPKVELPEVEYVEVYNRSDKVFNLAGWTLQDGTASGKISEGLLLPGELRILTSSTGASALTSFGRTSAVTPFPSLNNSADVITLISPDGLAIDAVTYSASWFRDNTKKDGGWSLELIDPGNVCVGSENWTASTNPAGGTPGTLNSVNAVIEDKTGPAVSLCYAVSPDSVVVHFTEKINTALPSPEQIRFSDGATTASLSATQDLLSLIVVLSGPLQHGKLYSVSLSGIMDCPGNPLREEAVVQTVALPEEADSLDVVINEILFNPRPFMQDFIELANTSARFIDLRNWAFALEKDKSLETRKTISTTPLLIHPGSILAFSADPGTILSEYPFSSAPSHILPLAIPPFNDDEGTVVLLDQRGMVMDRLFFHEDMHSPFIRDKEGVSLERVSFSPIDNAIHNWKSAAGNAGFATPGSRNSMHLANPPDSRSAVSIFPEIFLPVIGQPNFSTISFAEELSGSLANIRIFNSGGVMVKSLAENEMLGTNGQLRWDGDIDSGGKAPVGSYLVWIELFDDRGNKQIIRKRIAVAGRF